MVVALCIIGYLIMATIVGGVAYYLFCKAKDSTPEIDGFFTGLFWPLAGPVFIFILSGKKLGELLLHRDAEKERLAAERKMQVKENEKLLRDNGFGWMVDGDWK